MFRSVVIVTHALLILFVIFMGFAGKYNPAPADPNENYIVWFLMIAIFNILILGSAFVQIKVKKTWLLIGSILGLIALFFITLQYIYPYLYGLL